MTRSFLPTVLLLAACCVTVQEGQAQCRGFAKTKCVPQLAPYKFNEAFNAAQLAPGEEAEVNLTFNAGQDYRIAVCSHPLLGELNWKLMDTNNKVVFESFADDPQHVFDLRVQNTQQFRVHVWVPEKATETTGLLQVGCVAIMVGFKVP
jgi:hypothetical protein